MTKKRLTGCIPVEELVPGCAYGGCGRNFDVAIWDGRTFHGARQKFGNYFMDDEFHWDTDDRYGTFQPLRMLGEDD